MSEKLVSCVVPAYNAARFIGETLDSIFAQTHDVLEVIVVDDGSTDETPHVVQRYGSRVTYIRQKNQGAASARNTGLGAASGSYVTMLDADDIWHPEAVARLVTALEESPAHAWAVGKSLAIFAEELNGYAAKVAGKPIAKTQYHYQLGAILFRRSIFEKIELIDEKLVMGEDIEILLRIEDRFGPALRLDTLVLLHRLNRSSLTATSGWAARGDLVDVIHRHRKKGRGADPV